MKLRFLVVLTCITFSTLLFSSTKRAFINESLVLKLIDNNCGDSWCEGEFDFVFNKVEYLKEEKVLRVKYQMVASSYRSIKTYDSECKVFVEKIPEDIYTHINSSFSLTDEFLQKLNECIRDNEIDFHLSLVN